MRSGVGCCNGKRAKLETSCWLFLLSFLKDPIASSPPFFTFENVVCKQCIAIHFHASSDNSDNQSMTATVTIIADNDNEPTMAVTVTVLVDKDNQPMSLTVTIIVDNDNQPMTLTVTY